MSSAVVTTAAMRAAEEAAFARGVSAETLMDEAGAQIARCVTDFFLRPGRCLVFAGKGNNGGDALVTAGLLRRWGWRIETKLAFAEEDCGELCRKKLVALRTGSVSNSDHQQSGEDHLVVLDGLLGLGSKPPLREPLRAACAEINRLRREKNAFVFAVDQPSGLDAETGAIDVDCVVADVTVAIGAAKRGLLLDDVLNQVGRLEVATLSELEFDGEGDEAVATAGSLQPLLPRRAFGAFKNQSGRIGIVAGSRGLTGAASLCAEGALRGGGGLVEVFVPESIYPLVAAAAPAEAMIKPVANYKRLHDEAIDVWAIGPGLGQEHSDEVLEFISQARQPMVIDADALNIVAREIERLARAAGPRLLTPHPGEMKRLAGKGETRLQTARDFVAKFPVTLLFKGSRTIVAERGLVSYNSTGNPGMATGGMGDVLTGVCVALLAQKLPPFDAARVGAWVCGRAAELAIFRGGESEQSLLPRDVIAHLGLAFRELQNGHPENIA
ncbi:MAG: NAD(P)H-hydrate dehydratase [Verrucomicrobiota bacterium]